VRIEVRLYRGRGLISRLIRWQTRGRYDHASIVVDGVLYEALQGRGVVQSRAVLDCRRHDRFHTWVDEERLAELQNFLTAQVGKPYDWTMVLRFISRRQESRKSKGKWFCSELVFAALNKGGCNLFKRTEPWEVSPGLIARSPCLLCLSDA
jgi:uncharacterized protein YycO